MSRMLLGETQEDLATAMNQYFSDDHYTVYQERSGWAILKCLRQNQYDVIVLEIALSGLDAINVVRSYRAAGGSTLTVLTTPNIPRRRSRAVLIILGHQTLIANFIQFSLC